MRSEELLCGPGVPACKVVDTLAEVLVSLGRGIAALPVRDRDPGDVEYEAEALVDYRTPDRAHARRLAALARDDAELMAHVAVHLVKGALELLVRGDRGQAAECVGAAALSINSALLEGHRG